MSWNRLFAVLLVFEVLLAVPLAYWLTWQVMPNPSAIASLVRDVLVPAILIAPLIGAAIAYRKSKQV